MEGPYEREPPKAKGKTVSKEVEAEIKGGLQRFKVGRGDHPNSQAKSNKPGLYEFPGSQPVSLDRENLKLIVQGRSNEYMVCEKSDGSRYLMLIVAPANPNPTLNSTAHQHPANNLTLPQNSPQESRVYLIDRKFTIVQVSPFSFRLDNIPQTSGTPPSRQTFLDWTLCDGELVESKVQNADGTITYKPTFYIYDCLLYNKESKMDRILHKRLAYLQTFVLPSIIKDPRSPFTISLKNMYACNYRYLRWITETQIPNLTHVNDGLIFTPIKLPYTVGTTKQLLKWKPQELNTIDFELRAQYRQGIDKWFLYIASNLGTTLYSHIELSVEEINFWKAKRGSAPKIVECRFDSTGRTYYPPEKQGAYDDVGWEGGEWREGGWKIIRIRSDKSTPNFEKVVKNTEISIRDGIRLEEILDKLAAAEGVDVAAFNTNLQNQNNNNNNNNSQRQGNVNVNQANNQRSNNSGSAQGSTNSNGNNHVRIDRLRALS
eukprot:TRINITY_DN1423_c2_g1_i2.p1 TRINITY_DN1423_c2_g1~~TRINITY_DN1423_c2_g1_i2.p1  ORF type:complete len:488 (+),score=75.39 TRINITY_DN1423_c2_g1_i2:126-1589(+)